MGIESESSNSLADSPQASISGDLSADKSVTGEFRSLLRDNGYDTQAAGMSLCGNDSATFPLDCGSCGHAYHVDYHDDNRVCPNCGERRRKRVFRRMKEKVIDRMDFDDTRFSTFTVENVSPGDLDSAKDGIRDALNRLKRRDIWSGQDGGVYAFHCPYQEDSDTWNIHLHVVHQGGFLPQGALSEEWADVTSRVDGVSESGVVDIRSLRKKCGDQEGAAGYVTAYLSESPDLWGDMDSYSLSVEERAERLFEYHDVFHGANMVQPFGMFHHSSDNAVSLRWVPDDPFHCPECGADDWLVDGRVCVEGQRVYLGLIAAIGGPGPPRAG
jgi:predicted RNA-binding Zn-ribbon protein involved in translation (DUF1610 family)